MKLSLSLASTILLAAGSNASPALYVRPRQANSTGGGSCGTGYKNVVFNTGAPKNPGWASGATWASLTAAGVSGWIGFSMKTLDQMPDYGSPPLPGPFNAAQVPILMDGTGSKIQDALTMLQNSPPKYLELYNEPDFSVWNTPMTDPTTAANQLVSVIKAAPPSTTLIAPGLAFPHPGPGAPYGDFYGTFSDILNNGQCPGCWDKIGILSMHIYTEHAQEVMDRVTTLHNRFPNKQIWITELSPATGTCTLDTPGVIQWMDAVFAGLASLPMVTKVFWNCGEAGGSGNGVASGSCNPSLTNPDGSSTPLLTEYAKMC